jgi:hypothetical protein
MNAYHVLPSTIGVRDELQDLPAHVFTFKWKTKPLAYAIDLG